MEELEFDRMIYAIVAMRMHLFFHKQMEPQDSSGMG